MILNYGYTQFSDGPICPSSLYPHYLPTLLVKNYRHEPLFMSRIFHVSLAILHRYFKMFITHEDEGCCFSALLLGVLTALFNCTRRWTVSSWMPVTRRKWSACRLSQHVLRRMKMSVALRWWQAARILTPKVYSKIWGLSHSIHLL